MSHQVDIHGSMPLVRHFTCQTVHYSDFCRRSGPSRTFHVFCETSHFSDITLLRQLMCLSDYWTFKILFCPFVRHLTSPTSHFSDNWSEFISWYFPVSRPPVLKPYRSDLQVSLSCLEMKFNVYQIRFWWLMEGWKYSMWKCIVTNFSAQLHAQGV